MRNEVDGNRQDAAEAKTISAWNVVNVAGGVAVGSTYCG